MASEAVGAITPSDVCLARLVRARKAAVAHNVCGSGGEGKVLVMLVVLVLQASPVLLQL